jgi:hypothetical protein
MLDTDQVGVKQCPVVEGVDVEIPGDLRPPPKQVIVEGEEGGGLGVVRGHSHAVHDGVAAQALGSVEETGVFIPLFCYLEYSASKII